MAIPNETFTQDDLESTVHVVDIATVAPQDPEAPQFVQEVPTVAGTLPSPLLCPRWTFLASLILASKFIQDTCCSNRVWAQLSGLPGWKVGHCERALGEALEWCLWVGKPVGPQLVQATPATQVNVATGCPGVRLQSGGDTPDLQSISPPLPQDTFAPLMVSSGQCLCCYLTVTSPIDGLAVLPASTPTTCIGVFDASQDN